MDIINNTLMELKKLGVNGVLSNVVVTKTSGPWTLSYVRYDDGTIGCGCANNETNMPKAPGILKEFIGRNALDLAVELYEVRNDVFMNSLRISIASALSYSRMNEAFLSSNGCDVETSNNGSSSLDIFQFVQSTDIVAFVGHASWWIPAFAAKAREVHITELIDPEAYKVIDFKPMESNVKVFHADKGRAVLKNADIVFITGQTISNNTINEVIEYSQNARLRIMFGPTSSFYPSVLFNKGINALLAILFPVSDGFKQAFVLSNGYWYQTGGTKHILIKNATPRFL